MLEHAQDVHAAKLMIEGALAIFFVFLIWALRDYNRRG
jgi:hypothetical protein